MGSIYAQFYLEWPQFTLNVDIHLPASGITVLFGHSGSGKTTLLRCIAGLERPKQGQLIVNGTVWQNDNHQWLPTHQRPLGYVFQEASLFSHLTVMGNLRYGMQRVQKNQQNLEKNLNQAIELLGIGHLLERKPDRLSGGERSRVGIARALAVAPSVLLMDEPLAALDLARKQEILPYLERLHHQLDIPILYVSHAPDEVARLADHLVVMKEGSVVAAGPLSEVLSRLDLPIQLGEDVGVVLEATVTEQDNTWHLTRVSFEGGSLWVRDGGHAMGQRVRVRILARDVSIVLEKTQDSSILNCLPATVDQWANDYHPALLLLRLKIGPSPLIARITHKSAAGLGLYSGQNIWAQIKAVGLML